jgi:outer membrane receptor protein involved in Fe transport
LLNLSGGSGDKYSGNAQVNWNSGKFSLSTGIDYQDNTYRSEHLYEKERFDTGTMYFSNMLQDRKINFRNFGVRLGVNYDPNEKHNFHYSMHTGVNRFHLDILANTGGYSEPETVHKYFYNTFDIHQNPLFVTNNLGFSKKLNDKGMNLSGDVYYSFIDYYFETNQETSEANSAYEPIDDTPYLQNVINDNYSNDIRLNIDLSIPINKNFQIESGLSLHDYLRDLDVTYSIFDYNLDDWWNDPQYSNIYNFNEIVYGAYTSVKTNLSGFSISAGLRAEYMDRALRQKTEDIYYEYSKLNWFPSLNLSKNFNQKHDLGLAFSNRINRPEEYWLNPFPEFEDEYFFSEGNPDLTPELIRNLELNYRYIADKFTISSNLFYRATQDKMDQLMVEDEATGKLKLSFHNNAQDRSTGLEVVGNFNLLPWWSLNANGSAYYYQIMGEVANEEISKTSVSWTAQMVNTFTIKQNTSIQAISYYRSRTQNLQNEVSGFYFIDLALNHKFMDGKLSIGVQAKDIFRTKNYSVINLAQSTLLTGDMRNESPVFMVNVSYMINQLKKQTKDVHTEFDM